MDDFSINMASEMSGSTLSQLQRSAALRALTDPSAALPS